MSTFSGEIVSIGVDQGRGGRHELVVTAFDRAHRLSAVSTHQSYLNQATSAIVAKVAQRHGMTAKVSVEGAAEPYVLQTAPTTRSCASSPMPPAPSGTSTARCCTCASGRQAVRRP